MAEEKSVMSAITNDDKLEISIYPRGVPGYIYTPSVDAEGNLSWSNNGNLPNPETVNIMGPQGPQGLIEFQIVDELPTTGSSLIMYLLRKRTGSQNLYDEYIWVNNAYELISEGKKTVNEDAQYVVGYYYSTSTIANLNLENFLKTGEYALIINNSTQGKPTQIGEETKVILKSYQANIDNDSTACQELMDTTSGKRFIRTCVKSGGSWSMGTWALESAGGVEVSDNTPTEDSTLLWVDTDAEAEIFDPNNYYTKTETDAKIVNTLTGDELNKAPTVHAVKNALGNLNFLSLTQAEYNALQEKDNNTIYIIVD